jgi:glycine/D-amino acid oxidase-like deaminating enzyme
VQTLQSTYAIVSEPFETQRFWHRNALIWETATPYLYLRTTDDRRILVGGKDDDFWDAHKRDKALPAKARSLEASFNKLFPGIAFRTDFKWAGVFGSTKDGLPYIGALPGKPHTYFALGFGGNGITFSLMAARIITNLISGKKDPDAAIFGFDR